MYTLYILCKIKSMPTRKGTSKSKQSVYMKKGKRKSGYKPKPSLGSGAGKLPTTTGLDKIPTNMEGFDEIAHGGIPKGRTTLLAGTSGSGKTIFAMQFLMGGLSKNEPAVFVTFEETPEDIIRNMKSFGWDIQSWIDKGKFMFVDASPSQDEIIEVGEFDLGAFLARILHAIKTVKAKRAALDSISALFPRYNDRAIIRRELYRVTAKLKEMKVTAILTAERVTEQEEQIARFGVEEFVSDNVVLLHNYLDPIRGDRKRSVEILKFRGTSHETQDTPLLVLADGMNVYPRPKPSYKGQISSSKKLSLGVPGLDKMFFGGVYELSTTLVSGASGAGKTVSGMHFILEGARKGEKGLLIAFEESDEQLYRNAESFGQDLRKYVNKGIVRLFTSVPEELKPEEHFRRIRDIVEEVKVDRFVIDSLSALERIYPPDRFREFTVGLNTYLKSQGVTSLMTNTTSSLLDVSQITETHLSTATDNIIILKYIELEGQMKRALILVKSRGSDHDKSLHEVIIDSNGMMIGERFVGIENLMGGSAKRVVMPPVDVTDHMKKIDVLRRAYVEGGIKQTDYAKRMIKLRKQLEDIQKKGF
jgi:circadian clock protein KaiC